VRASEVVVTPRGGATTGIRIMDQVTAAAPTQHSTPSGAAMLGRLTPYMLSVLRIVVGLLFLEHGLSRLFGFPSPIPTPQPLTMYWFAGAIELTGGILITLGLLTRPAAFIMSGEMAFAYFISHAPRSFFPILNRGDDAVLYCFVFLYLVFAGAGALSLDALWRKR
jgi:putative oxidoreductase